MRAHRHVYTMDYYAHQSRLLPVSPEFKLIFTLLVLALCLWGDCNPVSAFVFLSMAFLNMRKNRVEFRNYVRLLAIPGIFIFLGCCALMLDAGRGGEGWFLRIGEENAGEALRVMLRSFGAVSALYFFALSTPVGQVAGLLRRLHAPGAAAELVYLMYRYIFILADSQNRMRIGAESRLGYRDFITSCRTFGASLGNLLVITLRRAGAYYDAMEARGYEGELLFMEEERQFKARWLLWAGLYAALGAGVKWMAQRGGGL